jgi:hypothetical protein
VDQLAAAYPWQLLRLYREVQSGELQPAMMAEALSEDELSHLVQTLASISRQAEGYGAAELLEAMERYSGRVLDRKGYYRRVLEGLVRGEDMDFEGVTRTDLADSGPGPTVSGHLPKGGPPAPETPPEDMGASDSDETLFRYLREVRSFVIFLSFLLSM